MEVLYRINLLDSSDSTYLNRMYQMWGSYTTIQIKITVRKWESTHLANWSRILTNSNWLKSRCIVRRSTTRCSSKSLTKMMILFLKTIWYSSHAYWGLSHHFDEFSTHWYIGLWCRKTNEVLKNFFLFYIILNILNTYSILLFFFVATIININFQLNYRILWITFIIT